MHILKGERTASIVFETTSLKTNDFLSRCPSDGTSRGCTVRIARYEKGYSPVVKTMSPLSIFESSSPCTSIRLELHRNSRYTFHVLLFIFHVTCFTCHELRFTKKSYHSCSRGLPFRIDLLSVNKYFVDSMTFSMKGSRLIGLPRYGCKYRNN